MRKCVNVPWLLHGLRSRFVRQYVTLCLVTFLLVLPLACRDVKHSIYFSAWQDSDAAKKLTLQENDVRLEKAQEFFHKMSPGQLRVLQREVEGQRDDGKTLVTLSVITVSRNRHVVDSYKPRYLTQVVWRLLDLLNTHKQEILRSHYRFLLSLCNVDFDPAHYDEIKELVNVVRTVTRFKSMHLSIEHPFEKEKQDYVFCLNTSLTHSPQYVFLLEDDALPGDDFFTVILHTLQSHVEHYDGAQQDSNTAYVKFYHPERLSVFHHQDPVAIVELVSAALLVGTLLYALYTRLVHRPAGLYAPWALLCVYAALVCLAVGRPALLTLRRTLSPYLHAYLPAPSCCTPAMLFPAASATSIATYMNTVTCGPNFGKDSVLDNFLRDTGLRAYLIQPSIVTHIGMYSALRQNIVDPFLM